MKMQTEKKKRVQFNARVSPEIKRCARVVATALDWTDQGIAELAVKVLLGAADHETEAKLKQVRDAAKALNLSFSLPDLQPAGLQLVA